MDEFALIRRYFDHEPARPPLLLGVGDDAALLQTDGDRLIATCCDTLVAGRHFAADAAPEHIGWKALAVNLSDLAAMGALPLSFLLALTLPEADETWLDGFARGMFDLARQHHVQLAGGDTTRGPLTITVTAFGEVAPTHVMRRDGARSGDLICVTGSLGDAAAALDGADAPALQARLHTPVPRVAAGRVLSRYAGAAIDISDGLLGDLGHIARASGVGIDIRADLLPASAALSALGSPRQLQWQATGGDDYELAVAMAPEDVNDAVAACKALSLPLTVIGCCTGAEGVRLLSASGVPCDLPDSGYRHF